MLIIDLSSKTKGILLVQLLLVITLIISQDIFQTKLAKTPCDNELRLTERSEIVKNLPLCGNENMVLTPDDISNNQWLLSSFHLKIRAYAWEVDESLDTQRSKDPRIANTFNIPASDK